MEQHCGDVDWPSFLSEEVMESGNNWEDNDPPLWKNTETENTTATERTSSQNLNLLPAPTYNDTSPCAYMPNSAPKFMTNTNIKSNPLTLGSFTERNTMTLSGATVSRGSNSHLVRRDNRPSESNNRGMVQCNPIAILTQLMSQSQQNLNILTTNQTQIQELLANSRKETTEIGARQDILESKVDNLELRLKLAVEDIKTSLWTRNFWEKYPEYSILTRDDHKWAKFFLVLVHWMTNLDKPQHQAVQSANTIYRWRPAVWLYREPTNRTLPISELKQRLESRNQWQNLYLVIESSGAKTLYLNYVDACSSMDSRFFSMDALFSALHGDNNGTHIRERAANLFPKQDNFNFSIPPEETLEKTYYIPFHQYISFLFFTNHLAEFQKDRPNITGGEPRRIAVSARKSSKVSGKTEGAQPLKHAPNDKRYPVFQSLEEAQTYLPNNRIYSKAAFKNTVLPDTMNQIIHTALADRVSKLKQEMMAHNNLLPTPLQNNPQIQGSENVFPPVHQSLEKQMIYLDSENNKTSAATDPVQQPDSEQLLSSAAAAAAPVAPKTNKKKKIALAKTSSNQRAGVKRKADQRPSNKKKSKKLSASQKRQKNNKGKCSQELLVSDGQLTVMKTTTRKQVRPKRFDNHISTYFNISSMYRDEEINYTI